VNRRQTEISVNLPRELEMLEAPIRDAINARSRAGASRRASPSTPPTANRRRAPTSICPRQSLRDGTGAAGEQLKLSGEITLDQIVRAPGVFQTDEELVDAENIWPVVEKALKQALAALVKMREREGAHLAQDLAARIGFMRQCADASRNRRRNGGALPPAARRTNQDCRTGIARAG